MNNKAEIAGEWAGIVFFAAAVLGYILNIADLATNAGELLGFTILRVIGIFFPPLGAVLGYF